MDIHVVLLHIEGLGSTTRRIQQNQSQPKHKAAMHHFNLHALPGRFPFLPNAAASSFPTQQQQQLQLRARHVAVSAAATVTIGVAGVHIAAKSRPWLKPQQRQQEQQPLFLIPKELAEVICGAVGEIVQVAVLYPVDTIKVGSAEQSSLIHSSKNLMIISNVPFRCACTEAIQLPLRLFTCTQRSSSGVRQWV